MRLASLDVDTVRYVAANMREWDRREIGATSWTDDPEELVGKCMACPGYAWVAGLDRPIVVIGGVPLWPGGWSMSSEEHTYELQSLMRISYAVFSLHKKKYNQYYIIHS